MKSEIFTSRNINPTNNQKLQSCPSQLLNEFIRCQSSPSDGDFNNAVTRMKRKQVQSQEIQHNQIQRNEVEETELRERYEQIQKVLTQQNINLKMQANYLASEIRKTLKREKQQKLQTMKLTVNYQQTIEQMNQLYEQNKQIKQYIQSKIILLVSTIRLTSLPQIINEIKLIIQQLCEFFNINLQIRPSSERQTVVKPNIHSVDCQFKIEQLNDKFQALMYEYKTCNKPQIRKQCLQIAKQIKQLKSIDSSKANIFKQSKGPKFSQLNRKDSHQSLFCNNMISIHQNRSSDESLQIQSQKTTQQKQHYKQQQSQKKPILRRNTANDTRKHSSFRRNQV